MGGMSPQIFPAGGRVGKGCKQAIVSIHSFILHFMLIHSHFIRPGTHLFIHPFEHCVHTHKFIFYEDESTTESSYVFWQRKQSTFEWQGHDHQKYSAQ